MHMEQRERAGHSTSGSDMRRVAAIEVAGLVAGLEPLLALRGRAVRPFLGLHPTLRLLLDAIVADRSRGIERLGDLDVGRCVEVARVRGVPCPHSREAVSLQLDADGPGVAALTRRKQTELVLNVVTVLVS